MASPAIRPYSPSKLSNEISLDVFAAPRYSVFAALRHCPLTRSPGKKELSQLGDGTVIRLIKRYGSRKLYDTEESRYVALNEIGDFVRRGQQVRVVDTSNDEDVTAQTLTQVIAEEGRKRTSWVTSDLLHDLIRRGEQVVTTGVEQLQQGVDRALQASLQRIPPLRQMRDETVELRERLEALEAALRDLETVETGSRTDAEPTQAASVGVTRGVHS